MKRYDLMTIEEDIEPHLALMREMAEALGSAEKLLRGCGFSIQSDGIKLLLTKHEECISAAKCNLTRDVTEELIDDLFRHIKQRGAEMSGFDKSVYCVVIEQWFERNFG